MMLYNIYPILNEIKLINSSLHTSTPFSIAILARIIQLKNITNEKQWLILYTLTVLHDRYFSTFFFSCLFKERNSYGKLRKK